MASGLWLWAALAALLMLNTLFFYRGSLVRAERRQALDEVSRLRRAAANQEQEQSRRAVERHVLSLYDSHFGSPETRVDVASSLGELRANLVLAEDGVALQRETLEFRDTDRGRVNVRAQLRGRFDSLWTYLSQLEARRHPLAIQELSIRADRSGTLQLNVTWLATLAGSPGRDDSAVEAMPADKVAAVEKWLESTPHRPIADPFRSLPAQPDSRVAGPARDFQGSTEVEPPSSAATRTAIRLGGFVKPSADGAAQKAAIELDGVIRLVGVGERLGEYEVESIQLRDSVVLVNQRDGTRLTLSLER